jgi:hypothetical protein
MRETVDKPQWRGFSTKYLPLLLKAAKIMKNKECLRNCHGHEDYKET